jgi:hypothetical protein
MSRPPVCASPVYYSAPVYTTRSYYSYGGPAYCAPTYSYGYGGAYCNTGYYGGYARPRYYYSGASSYYCR